MPQTAYTEWELIKAFYSTPFHQLQGSADIGGPLHGAWIAFMETPERDIRRMDLREDF